jgi:hypothetical protein
MRNTCDRWFMQLFSTMEYVAYGDAQLMRSDHCVEQLLNAGALQHVGNTTSLLCPECTHLHGVTVDPATFRGYCSETGHIAFTPDDIMQYQADALWLINLLRTDLQIAATEPIATVLEGICWKVGMVRIADKLRPLFLCRAYTAHASAIAKELAAHPDEAGIILLPLPPNELPARVGLHRAASLFLPLSDKSRARIIDEPALNRIWHNATDDHKPLQYSPDYRLVTAKGVTHSFSGPKQRAFVTYLIKQYEQGHKVVKTAVVMVEIGQDKCCISKLFKGHATWRDLIAYGDPRGTCRLLVD